MNTKQSFLGRGWSFPPEFSKTNNTVVLTEDENDIEKSLQILLSTRPGERIMVPDYGCNLDELLFKTAEPDPENLCNRPDQNSHSLPRTAD